MSFFDTFQNTALNQTNTSITQVRTSTSDRLTRFIVGALPSTNKIPGATGALISQTVTSKIGNGINQVLSAMAIPTNTKTQQTNPKIYANGENAAKGVWTQIENGNTNVPQITAGALEPLTLLKYTDMQVSAGEDVAQVGNRSTSVPSTKRYSPYAMDLFRYAPKHKFMFVCEFVFNEDYADIGRGSTHQNEFALVIKDFERPKIKSEYDTVNYYNFRTPIIKKTLHEALTIKFLDDRQNVSMKFFHEYLLAAHPLVAIGPESADFYEDNGFNWNDPLNSSSTSVLKGDLKTIIKEIKVYHLYDFGAYMNIYHFTNPKIVEMNLDQWTMQDSESSELMASFGYDGMFVELSVKIDPTEDSVVATLSNAGHYPMHPLQVGDTSVPVQESRKVNDSRGIIPGASTGTKIGSSDQAAGEARKLLDNIRTETGNPNFNNDGNMNFNDRGNINFNDIGNPSFDDGGTLT